MNLIKTVLVASLAVLTYASANAQYKLPASHSRQHQQLLAKQTGHIDVIKKEATRSQLEEIREREAFQDNDVFAINWNSPSVNAYSGMTVPAVKDLDVAGYVSPLKKINISSPYGYRPRFGRMHRGVDLTLSIGDTVCSAFDGKVRLVKYEAKGYGHYVVVRHDNGMETVYGHLSRAIVKPNQRVRAGQPIALGGNTGRSTGPHLHFETRYMGLAINPQAIIDFEHKVPHKDVFTFSKASYERSQHYGPRKASSGKNLKAAKKSKKHYASSKKSRKSRKSRR